MIITVKQENKIFEQLYALSLEEEYSFLLKKYIADQKGNAKKLIDDFNLKKDVLQTSHFVIFFENLMNIYLKKEIKKIEQGKIEPYKLVDNSFGKNLKGQYSYSLSDITIPLFLHDFNINHLEPQIEEIFNNFLKKSETPFNCIISRIFEVDEIKSNLGTNYLNKDFNFFLGLSINLVISQELLEQWVLSQDKNNELKATKKLSL